MRIYPRGNTEPQNAHAATPKPPLTHAPTGQIPSNLASHPPPHKPIEGGPLPGWSGGCFSTAGAQIGWQVSGGMFWVHSFQSNSDPLAAARLVQAVRAQARSLGFTRMFWQVIPHKTGTAMLKTLARGRAKIDFIQMVCEV